MIGFARIPLYESAARVHVVESCAHAYAVGVLAENVIWSCEAFGMRKSSASMRAMNSPFATARPWFSAPTMPVFAWFYDAQTRSVVAMSSKIAFETILRTVVDRDKFEIAECLLRMLANCVRKCARRCRLA